MERFRFSSEVQASIEASPVPFAVYQFVDRRVATVALSRGLIRLFGYETLDAAIEMTENDRYGLVHPDDAARVAETAYRFATEGGRYTDVYRTRTATGEDYVIVRAQGEHVTTEAGERLAYVWYESEGPYREGEDASEGSLKQVYGQILRQMSANQREHYDFLTGLPNMTYFFELADAGIRRMRGEGRQAIILFMNLSGMKVYNNQYGYAEGDKLIREMGALLKRTFRNENCGRFGQDNFAVFTEDVQLEERLERLLSDSEALNDGNSLPLRVGVYRVEAEGEIEIALACDWAKMACNENRSARRSRYCYFDADMLASVEMNQYIVDHIDRAVREGWIQVYYQPIVRTVNGRVCDEEALARWIDPEKGFLSPAEFIPALEEAKVIYKLDLFMVEQVLRDIREQMERGLYVVPVSVNLSRADFEMCDIVEEIRTRVDASGLSREMLTIEITESVVGSDYEFMKSQIERFRELGFHVWMDDFGSGYSSLDVLEDIRFDLIKFDMHFMRQLDSGEEGRIILTELVKMAIGLGLETVCEGVEKAEQVDFLGEIGCTKLQGYYYCKPIPKEEVFRRYDQGIQIGYENPEQSEYYATVGGINLFDMSVFASRYDEALRRYFDVLPAAILEVNGDEMWYVRSNRPYKEFMRQVFGVDMGDDIIRYAEVPAGPGLAFVQAVMRCGRDGNLAMIDEKTDQNTTVHSFIRRVAVNPVTGAAAIAIAVLTVDAGEENAGTTYENIARALSADYINLYYVDLETEEFIEYSSDLSSENLSMERHGEDFFNASRRDAALFLYKDDVAYFQQAFTRENVLKTMDRDGHFTITYRLLINGAPTYVSMKGVRMQMDSAHIIIGVTNVDAQTRQKEALNRIQMEQVTYARATALSGDYICIYTVDPDTDRYTEFNATTDYEGLGLAKQGENFFESAKRESVRTLYEEDVERFNEMFTRENVMREIDQNGIFELRYRLVIDGEPKYVRVKAAMVQEQDGPKLIIGVDNIDAQVRREQEYERKLSNAYTRANIDRLTGVKNRAAYDSMSEMLSRQIEEGQDVHYAIVLCDLLHLQDTNEAKGRKAGDQLILKACSLICNTFKHSPVFRVAGDEFAIIAQGHDYEQLDTLVKALEDADGRGKDGAIACGVAIYNGVDNIASVFAQAYAQCKGRDRAHGEK